MATDRYELTRSIIHQCPAVKLPQTFLQQLGMTTQIMLLRRFTDEQAQALVDRLNYPLAESCGEKNIQPMLDSDGEIGMRWWNAISDEDRSYWMKVSLGASPADAWAYFKRCGAAGVASGEGEQQP